MALDSGSSTLCSFVGGPLDGYRLAFETAEVAVAVVRRREVRLRTYRRSLADSGRVVYAIQPGDRPAWDARRERRG
jgi:hypothetical protein